MSNMECSAEVKQKAFFENQKQKLERKQKMLERIKEKIKSDPDGIWCDLYAELSASA